MKAKKEIGLALAGRAHEINQHGSRPAVRNRLDKHCRTLQKIGARKGAQTQTPGFSRGVLGRDDQE
jgi:hypothetical protein